MNKLFKEETDEQGWMCRLVKWMKNEDWAWFGNVSVIGDLHMSNSGVVEMHAWLEWV